MPTETVPLWKGRDPLAWLLSPTTLDEFIERYWEKEALILRREKPDYYDELLTLSDVNEFMSRNDIRYPYLRVVKEGRELPLIDYADDFLYGSNVFPGLLDNDKVFHHYAEGATLSFQIFQKCMDGLSRFCNALEARLRFQTQVNIFVTPPNSRGFTTHYDDHSFFIFQISGSKHWNIYGSPVELPLQEFRAQATTPAFEAPTSQVTLHAGDLLYLPKGFYHDARTTGDTSTHITLGIFPYTWLQVVEKMVSKLKDDVEFRRAPAAYLRTLEIGSALDEHFQRLVKKLGEVSPEPLLAELFAEAASKQIVDGKNRLLDFTRLEELQSTTRIGRRNILARMAEHADHISISFYDKQLRLPLLAKNAVAFILGRDVFSIAEMPDVLDQASNTLVVRKLMKEGLLTFQDA